MAVKRNSDANKAGIRIRFLLPAWIAIMGCLIIFPLGNNVLGQPSTSFQNNAYTVVIDPGHGGHNNGAKGPSEKLEKAVCLAIARELATILEAAPYAQYTATLTRSDDYDVPLRNRTAMANHAHADLFISIHTAASYLHGTSGMAIYFHQQSAPSPSRPDIAPGRAEKKDRVWHQIQSRHEIHSRNLAQSMAKTMGSISTAQVSGAPLVVLEGADMTAILIDVGYLTHPATEKKLATQTYQKTIAQTLARGINAYFNQRPHTHEQ